MLILLNILDLFVCMLAVAMLSMMVFYWVIATWIHETIQMLYFVFLEATGFATCLLSSARCISLYAPFYKVKGCYLAFAVACVISYTLLREMVLARVVNRSTYYATVLPMVHMGLLQTEIGMMILVVLVTNVSSILKLLRSEKTAQPEQRPNRATQSRKNSVHATTTVAILSVFYCLLHGLYLTSGILYFFCRVDLDNGSWFLYFGLFYAAPLNSAINPLIYLLRKKEMKKYLKELTIRSLNSFGMIQQEKQNTEQMVMVDKPEVSPR